MTRYFFDTADGDNDFDDTGVELGGDREAIDQAVRFAGSMIHDQPDVLNHGTEFVVSVRRDAVAPLASVRVQLTTN